ncbi:hypothetical protein NA56DRAFT_705743 [Hyaloscypha hepaticicola]|uniref:Uncharacterized protein n=1 Tax=Hyaloscypha hepaticicola TaxID=2082293 RepID=A0A2J6PYQ5_9HELO|nr:hypothetical protein NA56DRAFT_705743 [Hyaloscypha hepaticicola]
MADNYQHALEVYPSPRDVDYPLCTYLSALENGDLTLEDMMRNLHFAGGPVIRAGDILRLRGRVPGANGQHLPITKDVTISNISNNQLMTISVPPGRHQTSQRHRGIADVVLPNAPQFTAPIRSPKAIWDAISSNAVLPEIVRVPAGDGGPTKKESRWDNIAVVRGTSVLGTLNELRLALQFLMNETDLNSQLTFSRKRTRRTPKAGNQAGFYMVDHCGLYLKVKQTEVGTLNQHLLINLGTEYNEELRSIAEDGFTIVMVDQRVLNTDGLPVSLFSQFSRVLKHGPNSFPTQFLRELAGAAGWSNGYAHMGLSSLSRNEQGELKPPAYEIVTWTKSEEKKVDRFHTKLQGTIRHYPIPLTLGSPRFSIVATQYRKIGNEWVVDSTVHGNGVETLKVPEDAFEVARTKERTRNLSRRARGYGVQASNNGSGGRHSTTTLTGYEDRGRRQGKKRTHSEMAEEDEESESGDGLAREEE